MKQKRPFSKEAKFLAVAYHLNFLSRRECCIIADEHLRYSGKSLGKWRCGDVAIDLGLLSPNLVAEVLQEQSRLRSNSRGVEDPLGGFARRLQPLPYLSMQAKTIVGILATIALTYLVAQTRGDLEKLANLLAILSVVTTILLASLPAVFRLPLTPTGRLRWVAVPLAVASAAYLWATLLNWA